MNGFSINGRQKRIRLFVISFRKTVIFIVHECVADFIAETESA